jgi:peptide/nickel transport system substrate-binding protein
MKWMNTRRGAALVAAAAMLATTGCTSQGGSGSGGNGSSTDSLVIAARVDNNSFDPADLEIGNRVQFWQPVYDTLLRLNPDAKPQPNLATEWSYNKDKTVLTLQLRDDVTFTDGEPFNAEAVKANIEHIKAGTGQNQFMVDAIDEVVPTSDTEVELHLSEPVPSLLSYLSWVGGVMASPAALESGNIAQEPVGSGPYVFDADASTPATDYVYTRNEDYWNADDYPYDKVEVKPMADITPVVNALKTDQVNSALLAPAVAQESEASGVTIDTLGVAWAGLIIADREGKVVPELANPKVRQAINYAFDRDTMVDKLLAGYGESTSQVFTSTSEAYEASLDDAYTYDPEKAKQLMAEAGVGKFSITLPQWDSPWNDLFPVIADQLGEIGITVKYDQVPPDEAITAVLSGDYPVAFFPLAGASAWQDLETWVTPDAPWNMLGAEDPELDRLIKKAQYASEKDQPAAFQAINRWLVEQAWFAPMFRPDQVFGTTEGTETTMQAQNAVPSLWSFQPAG